MVARKATLKVLHLWGEACAVVCGGNVCNVWGCPRLPFDGCRQHRRKPQRGVGGCAPQHEPGPQHLPFVQADDVITAFVVGGVSILAAHTASYPADTLWRRTMILGRDIYDFHGSGFA